jgi:hypothetical protein
VPSRWGGNRTGGAHRTWWWPGRSGRRPPQRSAVLPVGGRLVVSEPPGSGTEHRWPEDRLGDLGLGTSCTVHVGYHYRVTVQARPCPDRYPRRVGVPAKRPLF